MTSIHVQPLFDSATQREKDRQAAEIAADIARFVAAGGKVQRLGTSPIQNITRRQLVEGGHDRRTAKKEKRA